MKIYPCPISESTENFEGLSNGMYINVKRGGHIRVWNNPDGSSVQWEVIKGSVELQQFTHATGTGYISNNDDFINVKDLTGNITVTPAQGKTLILNPTNNRILTPDNIQFYPGYRILLYNKSGSYTITFDPTGINAVIAAGIVKEYMYTGSAWIDIT
jgi:hypothetical protein